MRIYTTSAGPAAEDVYFALAGANGKGCLVPHGLAVRAKLLDALQERLPGLDNDQVIRAMGSGDDTYFTIWSRGPAPNLLNGLAVAITSSVGFSSARVQPRAVQRRIAGEIG